MIVSYDSIMNPPYEINNRILGLLIKIAEYIGEVNASHLDKPSLELRKRNRVKTIKASLEIEGNTLTEDQITAILENKRIIGPKKDIVEVINAIEVYEKLPTFNPKSLNSFLKAHKMLMKNLISSSGKLRTKTVGILKGKEVSHVAPPSEHLERLMNDLFNYLKKSDDHILIKSCVFHYEVEFIHPFIDGNGRMGRLWQTLILMKAYPVFEYLPFETIIKDRQKEYYKVLEESDKVGKSTKFIEFILTAIHESLRELSKVQNRLNSAKDRIEYFTSIFKAEYFTRKEYITKLRDISTSTASRDLKYAVEKKIVTKEGDKRTTQYRIEMN